MVKKLSILFIGLLALSVQLVLGQKTSFRIGTDKLHIDANDLEYNEVGPGDTLFFEPGNRQFLLIKNFQGEPGKPIVMINNGGEVIIDTDHYFGISIQNCRYFKLTGTGAPRQTYGFKVKRVANGSGMGVGDLSSDFEIDHISIENCSIGGIYAKTDPDCSLTSVRGTFTQYNTSIHDNYIANAKNEGLYVGSTKYFGQTVSCNGKDVLLLPSLLDGVKVYNNIIKYSGWDGIQVSSASKNCHIYNNTILFDSQDEHASQMSGIIIGGGSKCDCYNNFISQGKGNGIESHGLGGYRIFNNIIVDAGRSFYPSDYTQMKHGIFLTDVSVQDDSAFYILHNDIINPKSDGIRFSSIKSKNNLIASNIIINPGNFDYYENGNTHFKGNDSYVMFLNTASVATIRNNYFARNNAAAGFLSPDEQSPENFKLSSGSPLINSADPECNIRFDFGGFPRPFGPRADIGAYEYDATFSDSFQNNTSEIPFRLMENPVKDFLKIHTRNEIMPEIQLKIYNSNGMQMKPLEKPNLSTSNRTIQIDVTALPSGIYIFTIQNGVHLNSGKFFKQ